METIDTLVRGPVDLIFMRAVSHYVSKEKRVWMLNNMRKILASGGGLLFDCPYKPVDSEMLEDAAGRAVAFAVYEMSGLDSFKQLSEQQGRKMPPFTEEYQQALNTAGLRISRKELMPIPVDEKARKHEIRHTLDVVLASEPPGIKVDYALVRRHRDAIEHGAYNWMIGKNLFLEGITEFLAVK